MVGCDLTLDSFEKGVEISLQLSAVPTTVVRSTKPDRYGAT